MASKLGGVPALWRGSLSRDASHQYAAERSLGANGNSQSNRSRSNPTALAARYYSAERLDLRWTLGAQRRSHASRSAGGFPLAMCSNDVEAPAPWLRSAPHVGGDRRTTGRLTAIATNTLAVKGSIPDGRIPPWGGQYSELLRVRAYTACRCVRTYTDDDTVPRDSRSAPNLNLREEGRRISQGSGADHGGRRVLSRHFAHQTVSALRGAGAVAHPSRRSISSGDARSAGEREAQVSHQAARPSKIRSLAGMPVTASIFLAVPGDGRFWPLRSRSTCTRLTPTRSASCSSVTTFSAIHVSSNPMDQMYAGRT